MVDALKGLPAGQHEKLLSTNGATKASLSTQFRCTWDHSVRDYLVYRNAVGQFELDAAMETVVVRKSTWKPYCSTGIRFPSRHSVRHSADTINVLLSDLTTELLLSLGY